MPNGSDLGGAGFEPAKALPPDLQSGPFGRLGIHPQFRALPHQSEASTMDDFQSFERHPHPGWDSSRGRASAETRTHNPRFTKPMLYRFSYASNLVFGVSILVVGSWYRDREG